MTLNDFKDWLFELLNETDEDVLADIEAYDRQNRFRLKMTDGSMFELECREADKRKTY